MSYLAFLQALIRLDKYSILHKGKSHGLRYVNEGQYSPVIIGACQGLIYCLPSPSGHRFKEIEQRERPSKSEQRITGTARGLFCYFLLPANGPDGVTGVAAGLGAA